MTVRDGWRDGKGKEGKRQHSRGNGKGEERESRKIGIRKKEKGKGNKGKKGIKTIRTFFYRSQNYS